MEILVFLTYLAVSEAAYINNMDSWLNRSALKRKEDREENRWREPMNKRIRDFCFSGKVQERYYQKYHSEFFTLTKVNPSAGGWDIVLKDGCYIKLNLNSPVAVRTGLKLLPNFKRTYDIRTNSRMLVRGMAVGHGLVDADYSGELIVVLYKFKPNMARDKKQDNLILCPGDSIAQLVPETSRSELMIMQAVEDSAYFDKLLGDVVAVYNRAAGYAASADALGVSSKRIRGDKALGSSADRDKQHWFAVHAGKEKYELQAHPKLEMVEPYFDKEAEEAYHVATSIDLTGDSQPAEEDEDDADDFVELYKIITWKQDKEAVDRFWDLAQKYYKNINLTFRRQEIEGNRLGITVFIDRKLYDKSEADAKLKIIYKTLDANGFGVERYQREIEKLLIQDIDFSQDDLADYEQSVEDAKYGGSTQKYEYGGELNLKSGKVVHKYAYTK